MDDTENQLRIMARVRNPLTSLLRASMVRSVLAQLHHMHPLIKENNDGVAASLIVKGSTGMPIGLRLPEDLDATVYQQPNYDPDLEREALSELFKGTAGAMNAELHVLDDSTSSGKVSLERLRKEKAFMLARFVQHFTKDDMAGIKEYLTRQGCSENDLKPLDEFGPAMIADIVRQRQEEAEKLGLTYIPTQEELAGTGLSELAQCEVSTKDAWRIHPPVKTNTAEVFTGDTPGALTFLHPYEEISDKILALLTNRQRADSPERHAKDLVDLYIRTKLLPGTKEAKGYVSCCIPVEDSPEQYKLIKDLVRINLPARPQFHDGRLEDILVLRRNDVLADKEKHSVARGLLELQKHGIIGEKLFGERITPENANQHAAEIMQHAWKIFEQCVGVKAEGPTKHRTYTLEVPKPVNDYWDTCRQVYKYIPPQGFMPARHRVRFSEKISEKMDAFLEGTYEDGFKSDMLYFGTFNAIRRARDHRQSRMGQNLG
jgi:hypothetical protein